MSSVRHQQSSVEDKTIQELLDEFDGPREDEYNRDLSEDEAEGVSVETTETKPSYRRDVVNAP